MAQSVRSDFDLHSEAMRAAWRKGRIRFPQLKKRRRSDRRGGAKAGRATSYRSLKYWFVNFLERHPILSIPLLSLTLFTTFTLFALSIVEKPLQLDPDYWRLTLAWSLVSVVSMVAMGILACSTGSNLRSKGTEIDHSLNRGRNS